MKRQWKKLSPFGVWGFYVAAVLGMSVSCKTKDPCDDGSCCGPVSLKYRYVRTVENVRADLGINAFFLIEGEKDGLIICASQEEMFSTYENSYLRGQSQQPLKYRIWGRVFNCDGCPTIIAGPNYHIVIDKIEKTN